MCDCVVCAWLCESSKVPYPYTVASLHTELFAQMHSESAFSVFAHTRLACILGGAATHEVGQTIYKVLMNTDPTK